MHLYDAKEFESGKCEYCVAEEAVLASQEGLCECCDTWANLGYNVNYDAFVCGKCEKSLEDGLEEELGA
jgi:hypothetical protein